MSLSWIRVDNKIINEACSAYFVGANEGEWNDYFTKFLSFLNYKSTGCCEHLSLIQTR